MTVAYAGLRATGLYRWLEPNGLGSVPQAARPDQRFARYRYTDNSADSIYHSLQMFARHRFSKGIDFTVAYTYGNSVDTYSQDVGDNSVRNAAPGLAQFPTLINLKGSPAAGFQGDAQSWVPRPVLAERGNSDFDIRQLECGVDEFRKHVLLVQLPRPFAEIHFVHHLPVVSATDNLQTQEAKAVHIHFLSILLV